MRPLLHTCAALVVLVAAARADIAPLEYAGGSIVPKGNSALRMEKAKVEIVWGSPSSLTAVFTMHNRSAEPEALLVGFPMAALNFAGLRPSDPLSIAFDGQEATVILPPPSNPREDEPRNWIWYRCQHTFKPGKTEVTVKTILRPTGIYATTDFRERLLYCIETGGNWAGSIGEEEVIIRFPEPLEKEQITAVRPAGYTVDKNTVRWRFVDIEPKGAEFDIELAYIRPEAMRAITALRREVARNPGSTAVALKLARHLLPLSYAKSNSGYPPSRLGKAEYQAILANITGAAERRIFVEHYAVEKGGEYESVDTEWTTERVALVQILADAGYRDAASRNAFVLEGEKLLKDILSRDPHHAETWNVYLAAYWRFSFAATGHWFGPTRLSRNHIKLVEAAARDCPNDDCIRLWQELSRSPSDGLKSKALLEALKDRDYLTLQFPLAQTWRH